MANKDKSDEALRDTDPIERAVVNLILSKQGVFYASMILQMKRMEREIKRGAMGVGMFDGQVHLIYDAKWLSKMTVQQVMFCLEHEALHLVLDHLSRVGDRDPILWNIAADLAVNGYILADPGPCQEPYEICIPERGVFKDMPKGKHAEWYYDRLFDKAEKYTITKNADGSITIKNEKTGQEQNFSPNSHEDWETMGQGDESLNKEVVKAMVREALQEAKTRGCEPMGAISELIDKLLNQSSVNWKALLRRLVAASIISRDRRSSWKRLSRRFGQDYQGYVRIRQPKITVHFDTSGSMSEEELLECVRELKQLQKIYNANIRVIECDADIQKEYDLSKFTKIDTDVKGRGGTSHKPVWQYVEDNPTDLLISFTDMASDIELSDKPKCAVIFVLPSLYYGSKFTSPFGQIVQIEKKD
jgi:predicted metal-dependent peptidase